MVDLKEGLSPIPPRFLNGDEPLRGSGMAGSLTLGDFWRWSGSGLLDNTARGVLAEFIVASIASGIRIRDACSRVFLRV